MIRQFLQFRAKSASRRAFAVLAVFSLNLAAMPCTMALELESQNNHCPPMSDQAMVHEGHHAVQTDVDCLSLQADCCAIAQVTADNRVSAEKVQKDSTAVVVITATWPSLDMPLVRYHELRPPDPKVSFPPLHVLNCVYLK